MPCQKTGIKNSLVLMKSLSETIELELGFKKDLIKWKFELFSDNSRKLSYR